MWRIGGSNPVRRAVISVFQGSTTTTTTSSSSSSSYALPAASGQTLRGYAGKPDQHIKVPLATHGVSGKYAAALYVTAVRGNMLEPVETELAQVIKAADTNPVFGDFLKDPSVSKEIRIKAIGDIFGKSSKFSDITKNFLAVLAENGRLKEIYKISNSYSELLMAHRGNIRCTVTAALELTAEELEGIKDALQGYIAPGQSLTIAQKVDRSIIGGIVVDILDKHIDLSVDSRIKQMEKLLAEPL